MDYSKAENNKQLCWELYSTQGRAAVADFLGIRYNSVGHVLKHLGFYERIEEHRLEARKRKLSRNPFVIENAIKYYLLGFILGDGSVTVKGNKAYLRISGKDKELISRMSEEFQVTPKFSNKVWNINVSDWETVQWLLDFGIKPAKSKFGMGPLEIPEEFKEAFICGLLDSDGCIRYSNNGKGLIVEWWGHRSYMYWIKTLIPNSKIYIRKYDGLVAVCLRAQKDVKSYLSLMYSKTPIRLERKYERFKNFNWQC